MLKKDLLLFVIIFLVSISLVYATSLINFENPTPNNATSTSNTSIEINVSITEENLDELIYNWDGTNFTFFDNSLVLMYNFDNVSTGEVINASFTMSSSVNSYHYEDLTSISDYTIQSGDYIEYDVLWTSATDKIAFDYTTSDTSNLRDSDTTDQNGLNIHAETDLSSYTLNKWYHRKIAIVGGHVGKIIQNYDVVCEQNSAGTYAGYLDNILITDGAGTTRKLIFTNGSFTNSQHLSNLGSLNVLVNTTNGPQKIFDNSNSGNNGTIISATFVSDGKYGGGYSFNGVSDAINVPLSFGLGTSDFTISTWVNLDSVSEGGSFVKIGSSGGVGIGVGSTSYNDIGNDLIILYENSRWIDTNVAIGTGWHHLVIRVNSNGHPEGFIDGVSVYSDSLGVPLTLESITQIGGYASRYVDAIIDEVRIWNRSLGTDEIYQQYVSNLQKYNSTQWYLYVNQSKNSTEGLDDGDYTYFVSAKDDSGNENITETRMIIIDTTYHLINFTNPTPDDATSTSNTSIEINVSITEENLDELIYNWNGTNYTMYNDSLVLMYNFDNVSSLGENDTHVVDVSSYGNNGTGINFDLDEVTSGKHNGAFDFDGIDDYIMVPDSEIFDTGNQITTSAWIKTDFSNQTAIGIVLHDNSRYKWLLYFTGGSTSDSLSFYINSSSGVKSAGCTYAEGAVADNQWHLLTGTYDRTLSSKRIKMYYDGVECGTADGYDEPITEGDEGVWIGRWGGKSFNGTIDEVRVWNRTLSADEIYQQYISNLNKINLTNWNLYINQSKNSTSGLDDGDYTYFVSAKDDSGNDNITETRTITISSDITLPQISIDYPLPYAAYTNLTSFNYTLIENNPDSCWYTTNNSVTNSSAVTAGVNFTGLNFLSGYYNLTIYCNDTSGNIGQSNISFVVGDYNLAEEIEKIIASDAKSSVYFGYSVSISGDHIIVGAYREKSGDVYGGAAYIFKKNSDGQYEEVNKISASDLEADDKFGYSVSISGDYAIAGAYDEDSGGEDAGAAYIFKKNSTGQFEEVNKILASDLEADDKFGYSVSISGDYAIISAAYKDNGGDSDAGAAYIFKKNSTGQFEEVNKILASDVDSADYFGRSVSISGDYAISGAFYEDSGAGNGGAAYIFKKNSTGQFEEVNKILASDAQSSDYLGYSVSISGDYIIAGAYGVDSGAGNGGAAYIFKKNSTGQFEEVNKILASDAAEGDKFGYSVSISGDYAISSAHYKDNGGDSNAGAAYIFKKNSTGQFEEVNKISASDPRSTDYFGLSVSISERDAIAGAYWGGDAYGGAAYIFRLDQKDLTVPQINFTSPTPDDATSTENTSIEINVSITEANLDEIIYNWNGTNFTYYHNSLVLMYNFDNVSALGENDTYVIDVSGNENNGSGTNFDLDEVVSGIYGGALEFDGVDDYVNVGDDSSLDFTSAFSISAWVKVYFDNSWCIASRWEDEGSSKRSWILFADPGETTGFRFVTSSNGAWQSGNSIQAGNLSVGEWNQVIAVYNSTHNILYINGKYAGSVDRSNDGIYDSNRATYIGYTPEWANNPRFFNGTIDEVRIWNRSLSVEEVYQQYTSNLKKIDPGSWELYINQSKNAIDGLSDGDYNYQTFVSDSAGNDNFTEIRTITIDTIDTDNDGLPDSSDNLLYNESNVTTSGISNLNITVGGNATNNSFTGIQEILFYDSNDLLINFSYNFSTSTFDLSKVTITKATNSIIINLSGQLQSDYNKTVYITDNNFVSLCVKDAEISSINEVNSGCDRANETDLTSCLSGRLSSNGINCTDEGSIIKIENLQHSAIIGTPVSSLASSPSGGGSSRRTIPKIENQTCVSNWSCDSWSFCSKNFIQSRICNDLNDCENKTAKPLETRTCPDILFDSIIELKTKKVYPWNNLKFKVNLKEVNSGDLVDILIIYKILKNNGVVYEESETLAIQEELVYEKEISELDLSPGKYSLLVVLEYGKNQTASTEQDFSIIGLTSIGVFFIILIFLILLGFVGYNWYISRKKTEKLEEKIEEIEEKLEEKQTKKAGLKNWAIKKIEVVRLRSERKKKEQENIQKIEDKITESKIKNKKNSLRDSEEMIKELNKRKK